MTCIVNISGSGNTTMMREKKKKKRVPKQANHYRTLLPASMELHNQVDGNVCSNICSGYGLPETKWKMATNEQDPD